MAHDLKEGGIYRHYKGMLYKVHHKVRHSETLEWLVMYETLYENPSAKLWVRPMEMFLEDIVVDGISRPRFEYVGNHKGNERI